MAEEKILDRVRKLLQLAQSDNVNEAANAAAQAQALMSKHAIETASLETPAIKDEQIAEHEIQATEKTKKEAWKSSLSVALCEVNNLKYYNYRSRGGFKYMCIGRDSDVQIVRYMFAYLTSEIERLCKKAAADNGSPGKTWCNNFKWGAASEINKRLRESHKNAIASMRREANAADTLGNGVGLMRINNALMKLEGVKTSIELYGKNVVKLKAGTRSRHQLDREAREQGRQAGARIALDPARGGALGSGSRARLRG